MVRCRLQGGVLMKISISLILFLTSSLGFAGTQIHLKNHTLKADSKFSKYEPKSGVRTYLVQFKNKIKAQDKADLSKLGFKIYSYVPDDSLIVRGDAQALKTMQSKLQQVVPYSADYKWIGEKPSLSVFSRNQNEIFLVKVLDSSRSQTIAEDLKKLSPSVKVEANGSSWLTVRVPQNLISAVMSHDEIESIESVPQFELMHIVLDDEATPAEEAPASGDYTDLTGYEDGTIVMGFNQVWYNGYTGLNQIVSMADTGLDSGDASQIHSDFSAAINSGKNYAPYGDTWADPMGHGTHVAGSVLSRGVASGGIIRGGAYQAQMVVQGLWSSMFNNLMVPPQLSTLFSEAYESGARVHTNSWGSPRNLGAYDSFSSQVDEFMWNYPEMLIIFAAGNSGVDMDHNGRIDPGSVSSPGTAKNTLTVGASENYVLKGGIQKQIKELRDATTKWGAEPIASSYVSDNVNGVAMFSSRGPTSDGRLKPDVVAPGTNVLSDRSQQQGASELWGAYNQLYTYSGGTSMATPLTAGAAAVVRQYLVETAGFANPSAALVKAVLMSTGTDLYPGQYGEIGEASGQELVKVRPDSNQGYGRVDVYKATIQPLSKILIDETEGVALDESKEWTVEVASGETLTAMMVYTDAPGAAAAAKALVNDIDLEVIGPAGSYKLEDRTNNSEMIELKNAFPGTYKIRVSGYNIPQGKEGRQPFALAIVH